MKTWFTSDLHLFDPSTSRRRGFDNPAAHDLLIWVNWMHMISERDEVFVLGDISRSHSEDALGFIQGLPGIKHLIAGNHDPVHPMHRRGFRRQRQYLEVFETVNSGATLNLEGWRVSLSHFPFTADHTDPPRHMAHRPQDEGQWLLHGHTHSPEKRTGPREIHVGLDAWDMCPVEAKTLIALKDMIGAEEAE